MFSVGYSGLSNTGVVGSLVLVGRPISICAGERPFFQLECFGSQATQAENPFFQLLLSA